MNHFLNFSAVVHNGMNDLILFGITAIVLSQRGIGHKREIRLWLVYCGTHGLNAISVAIDMYYGTYSLRSACIREITAICGTVCVAYLGLAVLNIIKTLVISETNTVQTDRIVAYLNTEQHKKIVQIDAISKQQNEQLRVLNQGGRA